jgi:vacuolar-type H+-ATPase subunit H
VILIEILQLVDQLEAVLNRGWRVPFSSSLVVNEEECLRLIDQMRMSIPDEIRQAQRVLQQRDYILAQAEEQARQILSEAQAQRVNLPPGQSQMSGQDIIVAAQQRVAEARRRNEQMRREADEYALNVLRELTRQLESALTQVRNGIQALTASQESAGERTEQGPEGSK